jgi:putative two-component system response regulator
VIAVVERLEALDATLAAGTVDAASLNELASDIRMQPLSGEPGKIADVGVRICQRLHAAGRSIEGLPFAATLAESAWDQHPPTTAARLLNACSFLSIDAADYTRAFDCLGRVLEVREAEQDPVAISRTWVNIANAMSGGGLLAGAERAFARAISTLEADASPRFSRFVSWMNLIRSAQIRGDLDAASEFAEYARTELARGIPDVTTHSKFILHRNQARLWIELGDGNAARRELDALALAVEIDGSVRATLALASTQAIFDLFHGSSDIALTRLDEVLRKARASSQHLTDMLGFVARIELKLGSTVRAEHHLSELKHHAHRLNVMTVARNQALGQMLRQPPETDTLLRQLNLLHRQEAELHRAPPNWDLLRRIAVGNAAQVDLTGTHGLRVGRLVRLHAHTLNMTPLRASMLGFAAELHDIGLPSEHDGLNPLHATTQLGAVPTDVLHCESGAAILSAEQHPWFLVAQDMARYHHAHWDGSGYPGGVARETIPFEARLCAVADTFDTIVQDRFADEVSVREALDALRALAGRQLDPELVSSFSRAVAASAEDEDIALESPSGTRHFLNLLAAVRPKELV